MSGALFILIPGIALLLWIRYTNHPFLKDKDPDDRK